MPLIIFVPAAFLPGRPVKDPAIFFPSPWILSPSEGRRCWRWRPMIGFARLSVSMTGVTLRLRPNIGDRLLRPMIGAVVILLDRLIAPLGRRRRSRKLRLWTVGRGVARTLGDFWRNGIAVEFVFRWPCWERWKSRRIYMYYARHRIKLVWWRFTLTVDKKLGLEFLRDYKVWRQKRFPTKCLKLQLERFVKRPLDLLEPNAAIRFPIATLAAEISIDSCPISGIFIRRRQASK